MSLFLHRTKQFNFYGSCCLLLKLQLFSKFNEFFYALLDPVIGPNKLALWLRFSSDAVSMTVVLISHLKNLVCYSI